LNAHTLGFPPKNSKVRTILHEMKREIKEMVSRLLINPLTSDGRLTKIFSEIEHTNRN